MTFRTSTFDHPGASGPSPTVYVLEDGAGGLAEVWPALGFNCYRWQMVRGGALLDLLYAGGDLFTSGRPTRSGIPVLFPFPNRIRAGRFTWAGKDYQLPLNDPTQKNAIHGFACRRPWRVLGSGAGADSAWVTGAFRCSADDPASRPLWPADHELRLTYRLGRGTLRIEAEVSNPDGVPLPFGLGYHPYFRLPFAGEGNRDDCTIHVPAGEYWELAENLPTGQRRAVNVARDLNRPRRFGDLGLDDVLTGLPAQAPGPDGLIERAALQGAPGAPLRVFCSPAFRELVVFTPPHREAFCVEPYTCATDAINVQARGVEAGWLVLAPAATWTSVVELRA
jgi:aldose 1-epimerase